MNFALGTIFLEIRTLIGRVSREGKKNILFTALSIFLLLFSYPFIRVVTAALFLDVHGAKASPVVWIFSVAVLSLFIWIYNRFQKKYPVHTLYLATALFSIFIFVGGRVLLSFENYIATYILFIWKEAYIMLMLSMLTGHLNVSMGASLAKVIWGPMGAVGSLGGIVGGFSTSFLLRFMSMENILVIGVVVVVCSVISFNFTRKSSMAVTEDKNHEKVSPLKAIMDVKKYVFLLALLVIVTQFCINLANFKFNVLFDYLITDRISKAQYLAQLYTKINMFAFLIQTIVAPLVLHKVRLRYSHFSIPIFYMILNIFPLLFVGSLWPVAIFFLALKGIDYSFFQAAKEILFFPLAPRGRYGAKYIVDAFSYRFGKGIISFVLIYFQSMVIVDTLLWSSLALWVLILFFLFKEGAIVEKRCVPHQTLME